MHENSKPPLKTGTFNPGLNYGNTKANDTNCTTAGTTTGEAAESMEERNDKPCILHLFSGPCNRTDGFAAFALRRGYTCKEFDIENGQQFDLTSDIVWANVMSDIRTGKYVGMLAGPPCNTYSKARRKDGQGPRPLRGPHGADRYGLSDLTLAEQQLVKTGTLLAQRTAEATLEFNTLGRPSIVEQPKWEQSMLMR